MALNIQNARYVEGSEVFKPFPRLLNVLNGQSMPFTWGDANRTMIDRKTLIDALDGCITQVDDAEMSTNEDDDMIAQSEWDALTASLYALPDDVYIDLEN